MRIKVFNEFPSFNLQNSKEKISAKRNIISSEKDKNPSGEKSDDFKNNMKNVVPVVISLMAIPITAGITYKLATKNMSALKTEMKNLSDKVSNLEALNIENTEKLHKQIKRTLIKNRKDNAAIWASLLAIAGISGGYKAGMSGSEIAKKVKQRVDGIEAKSNDALNNSYNAITKSGNSLSSKYYENVNGIVLLKNSDSLNKNTQKYNQAISEIQKAGNMYLFEKPRDIKIEKENPVLWSVTSEFAPVKEGGLGSVPVEIQNNVTRLGIEIPTFIPMYQQRGIATFKEQNGKYTYTYKGKVFELDKVVSFKTDTYQGGKSKTENVEFFVHNSKDKFGNNKQLIFVKNDNYFNGTIYETGAKSEEAEKFAFFSKAVYDFAKLKEDITAVNNLVIENADAFNSIKSPDGMILNDWQASPIAALARYKAPMENAYGQLSDDAANKIKNMRIITIGHNAMYQGSTINNNDNNQRKDSTSNILNTLFDNYTYDIVQNAETGASKSNPEDKGLKNLDNVLIINKDNGWENHTNLLNMGVVLSDYFHPVSQNYATELTSGKHPELSGELAWALTQKMKAGSLVGIINGNDFNNLSIEAKKNNIKNTTGLDFKTYSKTSPLSDVIKARQENKISFYNNFILPLSKKNDLNNKSEDVEIVRKLTPKLELVDEKKNTNLPVLSEEELIKTPIITSVGRLVSQKGINVMTEAIDILLKNWDKDFPNKPKPIFYLAGQDGEGGKIRKYIEELKNKTLDEKDSNRVLFAHGFAPMAAMMSSSDFFLLPSIFEPCGLTQGEAFAVATPVIGSSVGGIVDTVNRNGKNNGILTDGSKPLSAEEFYKAMKEGLKIWFDEPDKYNNMVNDSLQEDFSWIQKGKKGPVFEYLDKIGFDISKLPEVFS